MVEKVISKTIKTEEILERAKACTADWKNVHLKVAKKHHFGTELRTEEIKIEQEFSARDEEFILNKIKSDFELRFYKESGIKDHVKSFVKEMEEQVKDKKINFLQKLSIQKVGQKNVRPSALLSLKNELIESAIHLHGFIYNEKPLIVKWHPDEPLEFGMLFETKDLKLLKFRDLADSILDNFIANIEKIKLTSVGQKQNRR
jgi:hypothetical protein